MHALVGAAADVAPVPAHAVQRVEVAAQLVEASAPVAPVGEKVLGVEEGVERGPELRVDGEGAVKGGDRLGQPAVDLAVRRAQVLVRLAQRRLRADGAAKVVRRLGVPPELLVPSAHVGEGLGKGGLQRRGAGVVVQHLRLPPARLAQRVAEVVVHVRARRLLRLGQRQRDVADGDGLVEPPLVEEGLAHVVVGDGGGGVEGRRVAVRAQRLLRPPRRARRRELVAQGRVGDGKARVEADGRLEAGDGLRVAAEGEEALRAVVLGGGDVGPDREPARVVRQRLLRAPRLPDGHAHHDVGAGGAGRQGDRAQVVALRGAQVALVARDLAEVEVRLRRRLRDQRVALDRPLERRLRRAIHLERDLRRAAVVPRELVGARLGRGELVALEGGRMVARPRELPPALPEALRAARLLRTPRHRGQAKKRGPISSIDSII